MTDERRLYMEYSAFEKVPGKARTYTFWDQTAFWFGACSLPAAWLYGALMAGWQGIAGALILIFIVNTLALIPWAYLGEMAAATGGSSMAIVRPAFGIKGSIIPSIFYLIFGFGWGIVNVFIGAISLSFIFNLWLGWPSILDPGNTLYMVSYIFSVCILQGFFAVRGNQMIKKLQWVATVFFLILGAYQTYIVLTHWGIGPLLAWRPDRILVGTLGIYSFPITFALLVDLLISYNWTWEFIGDFSRFAKDKKAGTWGPFIGANVAQYWWFLVGALAVVYLTLTTGNFDPITAAPSATSVTLGLGWLAALVVLFATITTNAANIYASALGISNILIDKKVSLNVLLNIVAILIFPLSLIPLLSASFVGFFIFFLDLLGAIVIPLWTLIVVDYFIIHKRKYTDDIFQIDKGAYWYKKGWNWRAIFVLLSATAVYWVIAYGLPNIRHSITAALPTMVYVSVAYLLFTKRK